MHFLQYRWLEPALSQIRHYKYFCSSSVLHFCISYQLNATSPTATSNLFNSDENLIDNLLPQQKGYLIAILSLYIQYSQIGIPKDASIWSVFPVKDQVNAHLIHTESNNNLYPYTSVTVWPLCPCARKERSQDNTFSWIC